MWVEPLLDSLQSPYSAMQDHPGKLNIIHAIDESFGAMLVGGGLPPATDSSRTLL